MIVYLFIYNSDIFESSYRTISVHKTKLGAYKAKKRHMEDCYWNWYNNRIFFGKHKWDDSATEYNDWKIIEMEVKE